MTAWSTINAAHKELTGIIGENKIEPLEVAVEVERLRQDWRPQNVRIVLLAESHVWTSLKELNRRVRVPSRGESGFVRFVYCLGYGESSLVHPNHGLKNSGTWQYWKLFHDCVYGPHKEAAILKHISQEDEGRIEAKVKLLTDMYESGIWLVDACISALVSQGKKLAPGTKYEKAITASWEAHVKDALRRCDPEKVLVIGKGVSTVLHSRIQRAVPGAQVSVIPQPNARLEAMEIQEARRMCWRFCR